MRMVVDLPAPLGPRKPVTRPVAAVKDTSSTAVKAPYCLVRDSTVIMGQPSWPVAHARIGDSAGSAPEIDPEKPPAPPTYPPHHRVETMVP